MPSTYPPEMHEQCKALFVVEMKDLATISQITGVSEPALRRWRLADGWDAQREARSLSGPRLADECRAAITAIVQAGRADSRPLTDTELERISKLSRIAQQHDPAGRFKADCLVAMDRFSTFLRREHPDLHGQTAPYLSQFAQDIVAHPSL